jgi:hypothetical protein
MDSGEKFSCNCLASFNIHNHSVKYITLELKPEWGAPMQKLLISWATLVLTTSIVMAADSSETVLARAKELTSTQALNPRPKCNGGGPDIVVCGRRETSKYRFGQRGNPYSNKFNGMSPTEVAYAIAGIELPVFNTSDWAVGRQKMVNNAAPIGTNTQGLAGILDPFNMGFGTTRKSNEIFWGQQDAAAND